MMMCVVVNDTSLSINAAVILLSVARNFVITIVFSFMTVTSLPLTSVVAVEDVILLVISGEIKN